MADLTTAFNGLLKRHEAPPTRPFNLDMAADEFLKDAHRISSLVGRLHSELLKLRQAYLSTAAPRKTHLRTPSRAALPEPLSLTDRDREEIDADAKMTLRDLNARIRALEDAENLRQNTQAALIQKKYSRGLGVLGSWAAGGAAGAGGAAAYKTSEHAAAEAAARQLGVHHEAILWFLRQRLSEAADTQQRMMETRLTRELEKNRSLLAKARLPATGSSLPPGHQNDKRLPPPSDITNEQMHMFEKGNQDMLKHYESTLDKVRTAEKSILEIAELQTKLVSNLKTQSEHIDQMVADSTETAEGVTKGNRELKNAATRSSPARYTFFAATGLCAFLIVWDLVF
ncbi:hypothetical protein B0T17DRAFT_493823 [Bombardia bombarda]|uniref:t-SNARE coiled-coil homology domain-containing protein n=1 Tax=Bombardia bombarda TaxID=252184 RepID=A0AA39WUT1_9PEZI|nr:hypothetical protein B0T17DRAFT_493823 [Bombardia bombarda]